MVGYFINKTFYKPWLHRAFIFPSKIFSHVKNVGYPKIYNCKSFCLDNLWPV